MRIQHPALSALPKIEHGFFTRQGGLSEGLYKSLNCGYGSHDDKNNVRSNRALIAKTMGVEEEALVTIHQVHSAKAVVTQTPFAPDETPQADAIVTKTSGLAIAVLTADCGPLLLADSRNGVVAATHSGWRGAFGGIIEETLKTMLSLGANLDEITAVLGPTISQANYEVDLAFMQQFTDRDESWQAFFSTGNDAGHVQFNLPAFIMMRLEKAGIKNAHNCNQCTYGQDETFFSYRRSTHRKESDFGRQISAIALV